MRNRPIRLQLFLHTCGFAISSKFQFGKLRSWTICPVVGNCPSYPNPSCAVCW